jgi:hypothetical protein
VDDPIGAWTVAAPATVSGEPAARNDHWETGKVGGRRSKPGCGAGSTGTCRMRPVGVTGVEQCPDAVLPVRVSAACRLGILGRPPIEEGDMELLWLVPGDAVAGGSRYSAAAAPDVGM